MNRIPRLLWALIFLVGLAIPTAAAEGILIRRAALRRDPSTKQPPITTLAAREEVELIEPTPAHGYYHVRTSEGTEGWLYSHSIELVSSTPPATSPILTLPSAPSQPPTSTGVASAISPSWDKPAPNETTFEGPDGLCGPTGDGGDTFTNVRKNRTDVPPGYHSVTWSALRSLPYPLAGKSLAAWTPQQLAQIQPYEGVPVSVVGYLVTIKVEDQGTGESTNCHFTNPEGVDWHMPLVEQHGNGEQTAIVVETTPRIRKSHPKWTPTALAPWVNSDVPVRISGWTLLDPEHRAHLGKYRSTLWEIHPITKIEVFKDGQWINLDELP